jgi:hypothetical protein
MAATRIFCWLEAGGVEASQGSQVCDSSVYAGQREGLTNLRLRDYIYIFHVPRCFSDAYDIVGS